MTAHSRLSTSLLAVALVGLLGSGCIINSTPTGRRGDITLTWDFAGRPCLQTPEVVQVFINIPGEALQNNGVYGCNNGGTDGIRLLNFRPGIYSFTIQAQNQAGAVVYEGRGQITVDGNVALHVTLTPTQFATREVFVRALFPQNASNPCALAPIVDITIDNAPISPVNCQQLASTNGIVLQNLGLGRHTIDLSARDQSGLYYFRAINSFDVTAGANAYDFSLAWIVGSLPIKWTFSNGVTQLTCAQAGVGQVQVTLRDSQNQDSTFTVPCERTIGVQGTQVPYLYYGNYQVFLQATGTGNVLYRSNLVAPPVASVAAGEFPDIDNPVVTPAILMTP